MTGEIELHAFMFLQKLFHERHWENPTHVELAGEMSGTELLKQLNIAADRVEVIFVNHIAYPAHHAVIKAGDRVALVPPGVPGPHRYLLGFKNQ